MITQMSSYLEDFPQFTPQIPSQHEKQEQAAHPAMKYAQGPKVSPFKIRTGK